MKNIHLSKNGFFLLLLLIAGLILSGWNQQRLSELKARHRLDPVAVVDDASPMINVISVVLGGFRGLLADMLWLRISYLQDEGKVLEIVQLADWIAKLQPQMPETWAFHAWNMAYNVSMLMPTARERWQWVRNGLELLRSDGIKYNPDDPRIYAELAWFFQHKIGGSSDIHNRIFKQWWAEEIENLLGTGGFIEWETFKKQPEKTEQLKNEYRMNPDIMRHIETLYGPLDWRLPESHALYWAWRSKSFAPPEGYIRADRIIFQTLVTLMRQGSLHFDSASGTYSLSADPHRWPYVIKAYEDAMRLYPDNLTISLPYTYLLWESILLQHAYGYDHYAEMALERLRVMDEDAADFKNLEEALDFAMQRLFRQSGPIQVYTLINGYLQRAASARADGDTETAEQAETVAKQLWDMIDSNFEPELHQRIGFEPFEILVERNAKIAGRADAPGEND